MITWSIDGGGRPFYRSKHKYSVTNVCGFLRILRHDLWDYHFLHALLEKLQSGIQFDYQMKAHPSVIRELYKFERIPLDEQKSIAQIIIALNTTINQTQTIIEKLKQVKQGLLHDLLTRGVDANGELRPSYEQAPELYQASPLGWIPKEWASSNVEAEFLVDSGITLGQHRRPRNHPRAYLRVANVRRANLYLGDIAFLEASDSEAIEKSLRIGDLLVVEGHASTEEIGRCAMADKSVCGFLFQNHLFRLRPKRLLNKFSLLWMNSEFSRSYWRIEAATSSGLNTINRAKLNILCVAVPTIAEQERITAIAKNIETRILGEIATLKKLQSEKSALMDDLLTGRVRVTPLLVP